MTTTEQPRAVRPELTPRELFVLRHLAAGLKVSEIQPLLTQPPRRGSTAAAPGRHAAQRTVERLMVKLDARTHGQLVHHGWMRGVLDAAGVAIDGPPEPEPEPEPGQRLCEWCGKEMPKGARSDARTDSDKCRRALARAEAAEDGG